MRSRPSRSARSTTNSRQRTSPPDSPPRTEATPEKVRALTQALAEGHTVTFKNGSKVKRNKGGIEVKRRSKFVYRVGNVERAYDVAMNGMQHEPVPSEPFWPKVAERARKGKLKKLDGTPERQRTDWGECPF